MNIKRSGSAGSWSGAAAATALGLTLVLSSTPAARAQDAPPAAARLLGLEEALALAARADPALPGMEARRRAAEAGVRQADVRANPTLGLEVENFAGSGPFSILERSETTLSYEQPFERGGDRAARVGLARREGDLVLARERVRRLDRLEQVQAAWAEALAADAALAIAAERLDLAEGFSGEVGRRVASARDPLFAGARAEAELATARLAFDQAGIAARLARANLATFWMGASNFRLDPAAFDDTAAARAAAGDLAEADLAVPGAERDIAIARVGVERARAVPDATVSVGLRHVWDEEAVALVVGGSIPLGRYDRNQGAIDMAEAQRAAAESDLIAERAVREREVARLQVSLAAKASEAARIAGEVIPQAERAVRLVREGFNRGGFTYNDVITTQTALLDARQRRVEVLKSFHIDRARLDRLTGAHDRMTVAETTR
ncbi:TolC family protein [uncultured Brevundimonas sp.]|uniref:TolC family protein n=1 Tax=uncultured Brevundimonas sp. TaxID=213418 RepID=UPI00261DA6C3|nr:TolC family protein [uncultured Brevundimonas sp.]